MDDRALVDAFAELLENRTGLATGESNRSHLDRALRRVCSTIGTSPERFLDVARRDAAALQRLIDAAMIGETYFFREVAHFAYLRNLLLPRIVRPGKIVRAWSASCSTGEEAVSLAVVMAEACRNVAGSDFHVYAGDVRSDVAQRISTGRYPTSALRRDGAEFHPLLVDRYATVGEGGEVTVDPALIAKITPLRLNVFSDPLDPIPDGVDLVFFRNTLIYAKKPHRERIVRRIVGRIAEGGHLFLANSELPFVDDPELELVEEQGTYSLRKKVSGDGRADAAATPSTQPSLIRNPPTPRAVTEVGVAMETGAERPNREAGWGATPGSAGPSAAGLAGTGPPSGGADAAPRSGEGDPHTFVASGREESPARTLERIHDRYARGKAKSVPGTTDTATADGTADHAGVERLVYDFFLAVDGERFDAAHRVLDALAETDGDPTLKLYCRAWLAYCTGDREAALLGFGRVLDGDSAFWPAHFYRGLLLNRDDPAAARSEFALCLAQSEGTSAEDYRFLMGGFSRSHIRHVSRRWLHKIDLKGA